MALLHCLIRRTLTVAVILGLTMAGGLAADRTSAGEVTDTLSPLQPLFQSMTGDELFAKLLEHNRLRDLHLEQYSAVRTYRVTNDKGKVYAQEIVRVDYQAPDHKRFVIDSEEGSWAVRDMVLNRLIESESETSSGSVHRDSSIKPANYEFRPLGEQDVGPYHCLVVEARPRRRDKYLFERKDLDRHEGLRDCSDCRTASAKALLLDHTRGLRAPIPENWPVLASRQGRDSSPRATIREESTHHRP